MYKLTYRENLVKENTITPPVQRKSMYLEITNPVAFNSGPVRVRALQNTYTSLLVVYVPYISASYAVHLTGRRP